MEYRGYIWPGLKRQQRSQVDYGHFPGKESLSPGKANTGTCGAQKVQGYPDCLSAEYKEYAREELEREGNKGKQRRQWLEGKV